MYRNQIAHKMTLWKTSSNNKQRLYAALVIHIKFLLKFLPPNTSVPQWGPANPGLQLHPNEPSASRVQVPVFWQGGLQVSVWRDWRNYDSLEQSLPLLLKAIYHFKNEIKVSFLNDRIETTPSYFLYPFLTIQYWVHMLGDWSHHADRHWFEGTSDWLCEVCQHLFADCYSNVPMSEI